MKLSIPSARIYVPDRVDEDEAVARTTHMCIAAHQDDIEIMAPHQILECFGNRDKWFFGVVATNGAGSPRSAHYEKYSDAEMQDVRKLEQEKAAMIGEYGAQALLDHPSSSVKSPSADDVRADIKALLLAAQPEELIIHNLADKHDTHVGLALRIIEAIRELPKDKRPKHLYGGEVWRDLDWMLDSDKVRWDVSDRENILNALVAVFDSQVSGGKRYDLASEARRRAHSTYAESHSVDKATGASIAMDLSPLVQDDSLDPAAFVLQYIDHLREDVKGRVGRFS